jgi:hypothetical protein
MGAGDVSVSVNSQSVRSSIKDGTVSGGVTIEDGAMVFNGATRVEIGASQTLRLLSGGSVSAWIKPLGLGGANSGRIVDAPAGYNFFPATDNKITMNVQGQQLNTGNDIFVFGDLMHLVLVFTAEVGNQIYLNGVLIAEDETQTNVPTGAAAATQIGNRADADRGFNGSINNVLIFNRGLTQAEITQIYNAGKDAYSPVTDGLVAQYSGRDYFGTTAAPTIILDTASTNKSTANLFEKALKTQRVNANSKYMAEEINGNLILATIEEAA